MPILLTGATGYIGSHTAVILLEQGYDVVIVDNLSNSSRKVLTRIEAITGKKPAFRQADIRDRAALDVIFAEFAPRAVIHFAGLKAVAESTAMPLEYYDNNVSGSITLFAAMRQAGTRHLIFSSSATVYGEPDTVPIDESAPTRPFNTYGRTKRFIEQIAEDLHASDPSWNIALLRYFNPAGAHPSGLIDEEPRGTPNNLMPFIAQVVSGLQKELLVFGNDYDTPDGTGVRDYLHVMDLARGHLHALEKLFSKPGLVIYNLGTGRGYSVLEMIHAFEAVRGQKIPYTIVDRRPGDIACCYADPSLARKELGWQATLGIEDMARDT
ncbi:MAG: UDP-glucose 4-epimerase GalE [Desulfosudaceae bacterium]